MPSQLSYYIEFPDSSWRSYFCKKKYWTFLNFLSYLANL